MGRRAATAAARRREDRRLRDAAAGDRRPAALDQGRGDDHGRVLELFDGRDPSPQELLDADPDALRACGLSGRKVEYVKDLAAHVLDGELELDRLDDLSDEEVIEEIVAVRGLGRWTAEMFLIFHLKRPDVFSGGDLGLRRAIQLCHGLEAMPTPTEAVEIATRWSPNRSLASIYLWESLANEPL